MMMIAPYSYVRKVGKEKGEVKREYGGNWEKEENADYGGIVQPSEQHVKPRVKVVQWRLGTRGLRIFSDLLIHCSEKYVSQNYKEV